jgi:hypothetical protein
MRSGVPLLVGLGLMFAAACTEANPPDEQCIVAGGICYENAGMAGCGNQISADCAEGFFCCAPTSIVVDGQVIDVGAPDAKIEGGPTDAGAHDAKGDAPKDDAARDASVKHEDATRDGTLG